MSQNAIKTPIPNFTESKKPTPTCDSDFVKSKESTPTPI